jgi:hypothetical protein
MSYKMRIIRSSEIDFLAEILLVFKEGEGCRMGSDLMSPVALQMVKLATISRSSCPVH